LNAVRLIFGQTSSITPDLSDCFAGFIEAQFRAAWPLGRRAWPRRRQPYRNQPHRRHLGQGKQQQL